MENNFFDSFKINKEIFDFVCNCENELKESFLEFEPISFYNQMKILKAMQDNNLKSTDFNWTTGYGYGDEGRDKVEKIYANIFNTEDALVRPNIVSGTHAISLALKSILAKGDELIYISGAPYDTLRKVIGIDGNEPGNFIESGIHYSQVDLIDGKIDIEKIIEMISENTKVIAIQRSTGYSNRKAFTTDELKIVIKSIKEKYPKVIIFVDNCYGEFTDYEEPTDFGADYMAGSLIKNPGGGLAYSGGYIVGKQDLIDRISNNLTAPGIGKECGLSFGMTRQILQGLFMAPKVVEDAIKVARLFSLAFEKLGYETLPKSSDKRSDIITSIELNDPKLLEVFCEAIQSASPVDHQFTPQAWDMPGYENKVIMAAGGFIEGSSIELSADGPMRAPYYAYFQGGLSYYHGKYALINVLNNFKEQIYNLKNKM
ncbi:aminotransferase class I/II-fold pyridoxal phosphate-dependent enzyme [Peptoniphilus indolicus]|uniref:Aluminum resistance protein n=2 Tax=Peptoniphilus indolicus TaxID=33030 RepID=G4D5M1_9FIRM|nr:methionine gamma-lyase family protein [Peptoniphilus indolicus]EGY78641.1 aluminum resistance protein [Peptoniphilus indolicus ATCC 29427]SUB76091.1 methionine gamma-lyase [Peptoniphilus indolicus]